MGIVKAKNLQLGISADATKTFVLRVPAVEDGTLEIRRGTPEAPGALLAKINADGGVNIGGPCFSAYSSTAVSLPTGTNVKVLFQTEEFDYGGCYDNTTSRFTPNIAGVYSITANVTMASAGARVYGYITKNGTIVKQMGGVSADQYSAGVTALVYMNGTTDYIEILTQQGAAVQNSQIGSSATYFQGQLVRAA